jgi:hypothetical protein
MVTKRKRTDGLAASTTTGKKSSSAGTRKSIKEAPAKLPYEMTDEETKKVMDADVRCQLTPKWPEPKLKLSPRKANQFLDNLT